MKHARTGIFVHGTRVRQCAFRAPACLLRPQRSVWLPPTIMLLKTCCAWSLVGRFACLFQCLPTARVHFPTKSVQTQVKTRAPTSHQRRDQSETDVPNSSQSLFYQTNEAHVASVETVHMSLQFSKSLRHAARRTFHGGACGGSAEVLLRTYCGAHAAHRQELC